MLNVAHFTRHRPRPPPAMQVWGRGRGRHGWALRAGLQLISCGPRTFSQEVGVVVVMKMTLLFAVLAWPKGGVLYTHTHTHTHKHRRIH